MQSSSKMFTELLSTLPKHNHNIFSVDLYQYQGFWYDSKILEGVIQVQQQFQALSTDIIIAGWPKTGNTWLKALCFAIATRKQYHQTKNPLLTNLPHNLVPVLEIDFLNNPKIRETLHHSVLSTHMPYTSLPKSITSSGCKIIYICRDPKDTFVSFYHFFRRLHVLSTRVGGSKTDLDSSFHDEFDMFSEGKTTNGPYWDHVLGYYKASLDRPDMFLFMKYEELVEDPVFYVKKLARYMDKPFSLEEELEGIPEKIVKTCSFQSLSGLEVNKTGKYYVHESYMLDNNTFFRKGNIGDWKNHMTPEMAKRIDGITSERLRGFDFSFGQPIAP
ncbi:hypothetical protein RD792_006162 [Penstemon davidsonii]|uniref:Sulfotransferase n=1 Tax=Penstemon davidsonii TaxID=160366 RepID=A0ABR0DCT6_9LAMI|nr:hypothetical protein RD792_006162 [Penstemon davidsonii]